MAYGLRELLASVAAGRSLTHALCTLATSGPEQLRDGFARFPGLSRMLGTVAALEIVEEELSDPTTGVLHDQYLWRSGP